MGQLLSIPLFLTGLAFIAYALKHKPLRSRAHDAAVGASGELSLFPPRLWAEGSGSGGSGGDRKPCPPLTPPHKGEGSAPSLRHRFVFAQ